MVSNVNKSLLSNHGTSLPSLSLQVTMAVFKLKFRRRNFKRIPATVDTSYTKPSVTSAFVRNIKKANLNYTSQRPDANATSLRPELSFTSTMVKTTTSPMLISLVLQLALNSTLPPTTTTASYNLSLPTVKRPKVLLGVLNHSLFDSFQL